ncbi:hypothetical protein BLX90_13225 [Rhizobium sp. Y9]|nr:hypothetical protein BLX90_13225 [Rhizobium sp. Y9]
MIEHIGYWGSILGSPRCVSSIETKIRIFANDMGRSGKSASADMKCSPIGVIAVLLLDLNTHNAAAILTEKQVKIISLSPRMGMIL